VVDVDYDLERLPTCRASHNGFPGWQITAVMMFLPSGTIVGKEIMQHAATTSGMPDYHSWVRTIPRFEIPEGTTEIQVWFYNRSGFDRPCEAWDSNYGANYRFPVSDPHAGATILFQSNWQNLIDGTIQRGGKLLVTYAPERMKKIIDQATINGVPYFAAKYHCYGYGCCGFEYSTKLHVRFYDHGEFTSYPIGDLAVELTIPHDAQQIEIYFDCDVYTTTWWCGGGPEGPKYRQPQPDRFYDSNYGANFVYTIP